MALAVTPCHGTAQWLCLRPTTPQKKARPAESSPSDDLTPAPGVSGSKDSRALGQLDHAHAGVSGKADPVSSLKNTLEALQLDQDHLSQSSAQLVRTSPLSCRKFWRAPVQLDHVSLARSLLRRTASTARADAIRDAHKVQLAVLGARNVGKSSILSQYLTRTFETKYRPTIDEFYVHAFQMEDGTCRILHMIDTAGPHDFPAMQRLWIQQSSAFVVVYSVTDLNSFRLAADILKQIKEEKGSRVYSVVLVGNKADLHLADGQRVACQAARGLSARHGCLYIETSAKHCLNIDSIFRCLLMQEGPPKLPQYIRKTDIGPLDTDTVKSTLFCSKQK